MANTIARLGVRLGIDSAEFTKGIEAAKKDLSNFASAATNYAGVASAAFTAMTFKALQFADSIADVAKANDVAISTVLQLSSALQQNGGSAESASKIFASFTTFVDKAADGSFEAQKAFKDVNVTLKDLSTLSAEDLFAKVLRGLGEIPDQLTRQAKAYEILGRGIKGVDIAGLADDMGKVSTITEKQTKSIEDAAKAWDLLEKTTKDAMVTFTAFIGTPMLKMVEYLAQLPTYINKVTIAFQRMGDTISFINRLQAAVIMKDYVALKQIVEDYNKIKENIDSKAGADNYLYDNPTSSVSSTDTSVKRKTKLGVDPEAVKAEALRQQQIRFNISQRQREGKEIEDNTKRMVEQFATESLRQDALEKTLKNKQSEFELDIAGKQMREEDVRLAKDLMQIESNRAEKIRDIKLNNDLNLAAQEQLIDRENQLANEAERLARARNEATRGLREGTLEQGFGMAMEEYFRNAATEMERGQQIFTSVIGNMGAAIDNFVRNGKFAFKDFARSIIQDIIAIQLKAQATQLLASAFPMFGGKYTPGSNSFVGPMPQGFADGGSPPVGVASLVGERGPELFIPKTAGTIIPNNSLAGAMGGGQTVNYNGPYIANMSAIDTQSSIQFLSKNKQAVWAANQSAQRSLPMSR